MSKFKSVGLVGRLGSEAAYYSLQRLMAFLRKRQITAHIDEETAEAVPHSGLNQVPRDKLRHECDLVIVVGGDGSLLGMARSLVGSDVPLLGINRGRLGFLTDISPEEIERKVGAVLDGEYRDDRRFLIDGLVMRAGHCIGQSTALNDVVLHPGQFIRMIEFDLFIDEQYVYRQRSDGLIISTPTGSTAYALSGGGPIMYPSLDAIEMVPMNPHNLSSRPIVVNGGAAIRMVIGDQRDVRPIVTFDGQTHIVTHEGDEVLINKCPSSLRLIHPKGHNFYEICRNKLGWERDAQKL